MIPALSKSLQRKLKSVAQKLDPKVKLGQSGLTDAFIANLDLAISQHELVKVRFEAFKDERQQMAEQMAVKTSSHLVWIVGHVAVFYRPNPDPTKRGFEPKTEAPNDSTT